MYEVQLYTAISPFLSITCNMIHSAYFISLPPPKYFHGSLNILLEKNAVEMKRNTTVTTYF